MQRIRIAINEIKRVLIEISVFEALLHSLTLFMFTALLLVLLGFYWVWAAIPAVIFFFIDVYRLHKRFSLLLVEQKVPPLREQLRTAHDNLHRDNPVVQGLQLDVMRNMRYCRTSAFVPFKTLWRHILLITMLAFIILTVTALNVQFLHFNNLANTLQNLAPQPPPPMIFEDQPLGENFTDIFGEESIAELGREELNLQINPVLSEINIDEVKPPEEREFKESQFPEEIVASTDTSFSDDIPKEHRKIIKRYFKQIAQT